MTHATADVFSQTLLRLFVPTADDGRTLTPAERRALRESACLALPNLPLPNTIEAIRAEQVAASHLAVMECFRRARLHDVSDGTSARLGLRAAALMRLCARALRQQGCPLAEGTSGNRKNIQTLPDVRWGDDATARDQSRAGGGAILGREWTPRRGPRPEQAQPRELAPSYPMSGEKTGPLRNGNPRRDLRTLPCCGARTRNGTACRQPAMRNGRCRLHGGKSTGARTEAGRAAQVAANTTSGLYGDFGRRIAALVRVLRGANRLITRGTFPNPRDRTWQEWIDRATAPVADLTDLEAATVEAVLEIPLEIPRAIHGQIPVAAPVTVPVPSPEVADQTDPVSEPAAESMAASTPPPKAPPQHAPSPNTRPRHARLRLSIPLTAWPTISHARRPPHRETPPARPSRKAGADPPARGPVGQTVRDGTWHGNRRWARDRRAIMPAPIPAR